MNRDIKAIKWFISTQILKDPFKPAYATFKVTSRCNLRCTFCSPSYYSGELGEGSKERIKRIIDNLKDSSIVVLSFEGGEPTLRPDILELLSYAHDGSFYVMLTTNGYRLKDENFLVKLADNIDFLHYSIDEYHWNVKELDNLCRFRKYGLKVNVQTVVTRYNLNKLEEKVKKVKECGYKILAMPAVDYPSSKVKLAPDPYEFYKVLSELKRKYGATLNNSWGFINAIIGKVPNRLVSYAITVYPNGDLPYPDDINGEIVGNLAEEKLESILESGKVKELQAKMLENQAKFEYLHLQTASFNSVKDLASYVSEMLRWRFFGKA
ncbi:heme biosynthesis protein [Sulfolobus sp. A20]|uniref:radical SAM protein n=1 Tax=Sulfolobaceae TaxID=118883 RepID=UPI0008461C15|nr:MULTISPECIES: radical SAM protein [unclassified Sulfolobus]TRM75425.1 radical SAM protein [Sulfolobus sp. E5]TRM76029.1 radical SAM protein [Sulfolobus sp. A20-N-F8]TRM77553.1 radical SAM protein [Sulfolobus sp. B5]TRM81768.1 radical SAM protein [Sulfolobus sp. A20-N-F6]TRM84646.1 radical SAM protein [Sulfolobus sp. F3]TRM93275.1 radical SAM protein [Sulfolobus sp. A20-N-G8]TRN01476.1 radical SAM protein [Sulfolobus sp. F1]